jgi:hypothetical protein
MNGRELVHELSDDYEDLRRGRKTPRQLFEKENNIKQWWHKDNITGKIDININMADKDSRKAMAT